MIVHVESKFAHHTLETRPNHNTARTQKCKTILRNQSYWGGFMALFADIIAETDDNHSDYLETAI